jgi:hypothetical protein
LHRHLYGATDSELYRRGARTVLNWFINQQGKPVSRPGTRLIAQARNDSVVLIPFAVSQTTAYVLELGANYLRVHDPDNGYLGIELITPWAADALATVQWAQTGFVMTLTHPSAVPMELRAPQPGLSATWLLTPARFTPPGNAPTDAQSLVPVFKTAANNLVLGPMLVGGVTLFTLDAQHPPREWRYLVSVIFRHNQTGEEVESMPVQVAEYFDGTTRASVQPLPADGLVVLFDDAPITLRHPNFGPLVGSLSGYSNWEPAGVVYYRGRGKLYGFIGTTRYAQDFIDFGEEPDYARQPLRGEAPFQTGGAAYDARPVAVTFFQQRRVFALDQRVAFSATDEWANHDRPVAPFAVATSPIELALVADKLEAAASLVTHKSLLIFTDTSVWSVRGADDLGGAVTPTSTVPHLEDGEGASQLKPLVIPGGPVLYVSSMGSGVRALVKNGQEYVSKDISWHAAHLFEEAQIVSWCFQRVPWRVVWAVRSDGTLLTLTPGGDGLWGWARHETGARTLGGAEVTDTVLSVCSVRVGKVDVVVMAVRRGGLTLIERMFNRNRVTPATVTDDMGDDAFALDSVEFFDSLAPAADNVLSGLGRFEGRDVWVVAPGNPPQGPLRVLGGEIQLAPFDVANDGATVSGVVGLPYVCDLGSLDSPTARLNTKTVVKVGIDVDRSTGMLVGEDDAHLLPTRVRNASDGFGTETPTTTQLVMTVKGKWARTGRAFVRQERPLPTIVLGLERELEVGGS